MVWLGSGLGLVEILYGVAKSCQEHNIVTCIKYGVVWLGLGFRLMEIPYGNVLLLRLVVTKTSPVNLSPSLSESKS